MSSSLQKWAADECSSVRPLYFSQDGDPQFISSSEFVKAVQTALKRDGDSDESLQAAKDYIMSEMTTYIPIMAFAIIVFRANPATSHIDYYVLELRIITVRKLMSVDGFVR